MFVGHFAVGFIGKRVEPKVSLGTLILAAMLADLLWPIFMMAGVERVNFKPGRGAANYAEVVDIAMSHSLLMDVVWGTLFAVAYFAMRRQGRGAWILFIAVVSHWVLDFISHRPDMPLAPGVPRYLGLGLWTSIPATLIVEGALWLIAIILYVRLARPATLAGVYAFWVGTALLTLLWYNNIAGPPPPARTAPFGSLITFSLAVAWGYWMNRVRRVHARVASGERE